MKRSHSGQDVDEPSKKRSVTHLTFTKWQTELDKELQTMSWLDCEVKNEGVKKMVTKLSCKVCRKFKSKIAGRRNYSNKWIVGADSVRTSNIKDHAGTDQLWWSDKVRRPNQRPRKDYAARCSSSTNDISPDDSGEESDAGTELLQEWDDWIDK